MNDVNDEDNGEFENENRTSDENEYYSDYGEETDEELENELPDATGKLVHNAQIARIHLLSCVHCMCTDTLVIMYKLQVHKCAYFLYTNSMCTNTFVFYA